MSNSSTSRRYAALALAALVLAGCNKDGAETPAAPAATTEAPAPAAPAAPAAPVVSELNEAIPAADIKTRLALVGAPTYFAKDDLLLFDVEVINDGKATLVSAGKMPVRLGIILASPNGVDTKEGKRDFARAMLPAIPPGGKGIVHARAPAEGLLGMRVRGELVQEGVAWFGLNYNQPVLGIGKFQRCNGQPGTLCDEAGNPLAPAAAAPAPAAP